MYTLLTRLMRITGEKPHQCTICLKNFRLRKAMRAHMRIHVRPSSGTIQFYVFVCDYYFSFIIFVCIYRPANDLINVRFATWIL